MQPPRACRVVSRAFSVLTAASLAGCIHSPSGAAPLTAAEVAERFRQVTGDRLVVEPFSEELEGIIPRVDYVAPERPLSAALRKKYGNFFIAVYETSVPAHQRTGRADEGEIVWEDLLNELSRHPHYVGAFKIYKPNVQLRWFPASRKRKTNEQWERLDATLTAIMAGRD